jgi:hypothetical protein
MKRLVYAIVASSVLAGLCGCTTYYRVTDPTTKRVYYTTELRKERGGAVELRDGRTGSTVTIQNSEVKQVPKEEYETGRLSSGDVVE